MPLQLVDSDKKTFAPRVAPLSWGIYPGHLTLFNGETGAGKSVYLYNLAFHLTNGVPFLGHGNEGVEHSVIYIDAENGDGELDDYARGIDLPLTSRLALSNKDFCLSNPFDFQELVKAIEERKPALVIIDTSNACFNVEDEKSQKDAERVTQPLMRLAAEFGCAIVLARHISGKYNDDSGPATRSRKLGTGSHAWGSGPRSIIALQVHRPANGDLGVCRLEKLKDSPGHEQGKSLYYRQTETFGCECCTEVEYNAALTASTSARQSRSGEAEPLVLEAIKSAGSLNQAGIYREIETKGYARKAVDSALKNLCNAGNLMLAKVGGKCVYSLPSAGTVEA